ncbi:putative disease resistance protein RGA4 [Oryza brachyantha]|uniref:putative disease resistance protein RGA4 n=1 Tax=Oryza brachyantha TaxID=4533 RepID=UPI001ADA9658|nr:putative disease resistance protein RGA4 [Oryza brachyantha]XP_040385254.1 putative disease resistance protein RGA4 [Oryza brachyantha]XP_040385255.1 putative disease resistance protein RGA4 [Oryza brachyantha]XP_040385256.1 putative disease resistance protein RGA4 [Oryza brachyantha]XP_040385257.1 putative disease resistance protein RGA4 [Oryza brachyantha]XP_040385258.1 putative disease resistance protein RGA4 [Oryza brachyantha]
MANSAAAVFAGKSVAAPVIKEIITKGLSYLEGYFSTETVEGMKSKLQRGMPKIQAVLNVVSVDQIQIKSRSSDLDAWFWQLRDAVEEAEDAIDELEYYELEERAKDDRVSDWGSPFAKMKHKVVKSVKHVGVLDKTVKQLTHHGTIKRLKKAMEGLDRVAEDITGILAVTEYLKGATSINRNQLQNDLMSNDRETGSMLATTKFVGRESEKSRIVEWLTKNVPVDQTEIMLSVNYVPIFSIVGHGGMGKTTLAQSICQHDEVVKNFKIIWITVSNIFNAESVTRKILESATGDEPSAKHLDTLQKDRKEKLENAKFLLVLDDVWEDGKRSEWEKLFTPLRSGKSGSKILLTTRMTSVADIAANVMGVGRDCLMLTELSEDENIELFHHHAFSGVNLQDYMHLKLIGEKIARKLGGCPLVTKVASAHLQGNMTIEYWNSFLCKGLEHFKGTEDDIMNILKLSYNYLPTELQVCFRYCSLFHEDYRFDRKKIVQMWMGSGIISQAESDTLTLEDIGELFLAQLTRKFFL